MGEIQWLGLVVSLLNAVMAGIAWALSRRMPNIAGVLHRVPTMAMFLLALMGVYSASTPLWAADVPVEALDIARLMTLTVRTTVLVLLVTTTIFIIRYIRRD